MIIVVGCSAAFSINDWLRCQVMSSRASLEARVCCQNLRNSTKRTPNAVQGTKKGFTAQVGVKNVRKFTCVPSLFRPS